MKSNKLALVGAALTSLLAVACTQEGPSSGATLIDDSPEATAFRYRQGVMRGVAWKMGVIRGMAQGEIPVDEAAFKKHTSDLAALSGMLPEGFIPNSGTVEGTAALAEIWTSQPDFLQKAADFQMAAQGLADAAMTGGVAAASGMIQGVAQTCGACHRPYRRREE
jgi:cytochrome c556